MDPGLADGLLRAGFNGPHRAGIAGPPAVIPTGCLLPDPRAEDSGAHTNVAGGYTPPALPHAVDLPT